MRSQGGGVAGRLGGAAQAMPCGCRVECLCASNTPCHVSSTPGDSSSEHAMSCSTAAHPAQRVSSAGYLPAEHVRASCSAALLRPTRLQSVLAMPPCCAPAIAYLLAEVAEEAAKHASGVAPGGAHGNVCGRPCAYTRRAMRSHTARHALLTLRPSPHVPFITARMARAALCTSTWSIRTHMCANRVSKLNVSWTGQPPVPCYPPEISPRYPQDIPKISPRYPPDIPRYPPEISPRYPQISPRYPPDIPQISPDSALTNPQPPCSRPACSSLPCQPG
eukprot:359768-Chlamydomonas_euryale.AAC.14